MALEVIRTRHVNAQMRPAVLVPRRWLLLGAFAVAFLGAVVGGVIAATSTLLLRADARALSSSLAARVGHGALNLQSERDLNLTGGHVRVVGRDGNFEFEHAATAPVTRLNAYVAGTATRSPIAVGGSGDGNDIVPLLVQGIRTQRSDLQQWQLNGRVVAAVDGRGRLRFGSVSLWAALIDGKPALFVQVPGEKPQRLLLAAG